MKYPPSTTIAVDVDGTLYVNDALNEHVAEFCRRMKQQGFTLNLWSARGKQHAIDVATRFSVIHLFDDITSKPGYIIDDKGWEWIRFTRVIRTPQDILEPPP